MQSLLHTENKLASRASCIHLAAALVLTASSTAVAQEAWVRQSPLPYQPLAAESMAFATPGNLDGDGAVGVPDLLALLAAWGPCTGPCPPSCPADIDGDCIVGVPDLLILLANWG